MGVRAKGRGPFECGIQREGACFPFRIGGGASKLIVRSTDLLGIFGFGLYLAWMYLMLSCAAAGPETPQLTKSLLVLAFLLGEVLAALIIAPTAEHLVRARAVDILSVAVAVLVGLPVLAEIARFGEVLLFAAWLLAGAGTVVLLALWGFFLADLAHPQACMYPALSTLIAAVVLLVIMLGLKDQAAPLACFLVALLSVGLFMLWRRKVAAAGDYVVPQNNRPPDFRSLFHSAVAMVANSFLIGFGFYALAMTSSVAVQAIIIGALVCAAVFKVIDVRFGPRYQVSLIIRIIAPVVATCLLLLPYVPLEGRILLIFIMVLVAMIDEIICWTAVAEYMRIHQVQPFANMAFGRFGDILGLGLGFFSASIILSPSIDSPIAPSVFISIIAIAFIFLQAFVFKDNYTPFVEHFAMDADIEEARQDGPPEDGQPPQGAWRQKIIRFADCNGLTPRQTEVLFLLSRRYSMSMIEKELVVSIHTVKAHIYSIYQKTDVHSRQELIEKIESFESEG